VRAVERYLSRGFQYSETPRASRFPLETFLFEDKAGYCQQFSGAMALLLRLGGVPARVAAGFSPGIQDAERGNQWIVRDLDAHSWVEVYFPDIGWVTRDPTPAGSPARSQLADLAPLDQGAAVGLGGERAPATRAPAPRADRGGSTGAGPAASGSRWRDVALAAAALVLVLIGAALLLGRRRRRRTIAAGGDPDLAELRRALQRSRHSARPDLTLDVLAGRYAGTRAEAYVRTLLSARFGYGAGAPTRAQRAGLRRELGRGLGVGGRARAWWALPPRL
jgi:hypothetical protein